MFLVFSGIFSTLPRANLRIFLSILLLYFALQWLQVKHYFAKLNFRYSCIWFWGFCRLKAHLRERILKENLFIFLLERFVLQNRRSGANIRKILTFGLAFYQGKLVLVIFGRIGEALEVTFLLFRGFFFILVY